jgi:AraC family transcriptional regulator
VYHDDPDITEQDKLRVSACITVPEGTPVDADVGEMTIPDGKFAVATFESSPSEYGEAWDTVYGKWMPESGYQPDDRLCYELYHYDPEKQDSQTHVVDICVPVKPL